MFAVGCLRAGVAAVDVTPPLGIKMSGYFEERVARDIHDQLFAKALVLDDGETRLAVVVCDLIGVERRYLDEAKRMVYERTGIAPSNVLICCTHTHTGPDVGDMDYGSFLTRRIADAVQLAVNRLTDVELGVEREEEAKPLGNRRFYMKDGTVWTNPGILNPNIVKPAGPVDPEINVLCVRKPNGDTVGLMVNYAMHYAGLSPTEKREDMYTISADYFGVFSNIIQRIRGEEFVAMLANGACGDVIMFDAMKPHKEVNKFFGHAERVASLLAGKTIWAWNQMHFKNRLKLAASMEEVSIPRRFPTEEELKFASKLARGEVKAVNMRHYALKYFFYPRLEEFINAPKHVKTWVQVLAVGDLAAIVGLPGEIFVEHGLKIKKESPFKYTFICELANDYVGYVPTLKAFREEGDLTSSGSYETTIGPNILTPEAGDAMVETALEKMNRLYETVRE
ncbi:MAG: hypothetical protein QXR45_07070 [Candidatus Bathyarchaeia archaeon]